MLDSIKIKIKNFKEYIKKGGIVYAKHTEPKNFEDLFLKGKTVIITDGFTAIGKMIAEEISKMGATVIITGKEPEELDMAVGKILNCHGMIWDIANFHIANEMMRKAQGIYGRIDILINCAGFHNITEIENMTLEIYNRVMDGNMKGMYFVTKAFIDINASKPANEMKRIINILSMYSYKSGTSAYTMSKWQELCFTKGLAKELLAKHIIVNAVVPCPVYEISDIGKMDSGGKQHVINVVKFLASDFSNGIVGQVITADGGASLI